jgi:alpha-L-rhamnosidase
LNPVHLTVEHLEQALVDPGVDLPRFSWELEAPVGIKNANTTQHRVRVATDPAKLQTADIWDSGWVATSRAHTIDFSSDSPLDLPEASTIYWQAQSAIADESGELVPCMQSSVHTFRTGVKDWAKAQWLCKNNAPPVDDCALYSTNGSNAAPLFRAEFEIAQNYPGKTIKSAKAFVSGLGHYNLYVNGQHINADRFLDPGPASYGKRIYYNGFDVTTAATSEYPHSSLVAHKPQNAFFTSDGLLLRKALTAR